MSFTIKCVLFRVLLVSFVVSVLFLPGAFAQPDVQNSSRRQIRNLQILVLEGQKAESYPGRPGVPPVIEIRDDLDRPVEGVQVTFDLPMTGPGGIFEGGERRVITKTNSQGQATPVSFSTGTEIGPFFIRVSAKYRDVSAQTSVLQVVAVRPRPTEAILRPKSSTKKWVILGVIAGAAGGGLAYALTRGSGHPVKINLGGAVFTQP